MDRSSEEAGDGVDQVATAAVSSCRATLDDPMRRAGDGGGHRLCSCERFRPVCGVRKVPHCQEGLAVWDACGFG